MFELDYSGAPRARPRAHEPGRPRLRHRPIAARLSRDSAAPAAHAAALPPVRAAGRSRLRHRRARRQPRACPRRDRLPRDRARAAARLRPRAARAVRAARRGSRCVEAAVAGAGGEAWLSVSERTPTVSTLASPWREARSREPGFGGVEWNRRVRVRTVTADDADRAVRRARVREDRRRRWRARGARRPQPAGAARSRSSTCRARSTRCGRAPTGSRRWRARMRAYEFNWSVGESYVLASARVARRARAGRRVGGARCRRAIGRRVRAAAEWTWGPASAGPAGRLKAAPTYFAAGGACRRAGGDPQASRRTDACRPGG